LSPKEFADPKYKDKTGPECVMYLLQLKTEDIIKCTIKRIEDCNKESAILIIKDI
jgi:hypothetical protein